MYVDLGYCYGKFKLQGDPQVQTWMPDRYTWPGIKVNNTSSPKPNRSDGSVYLRLADYSVSLGFPVMQPFRAICTHSITAIT